MKTKILLMPLIIAVAVILSIWLVYPAYTNGDNGVKEKYAELESIQEKISSLDEKANNVSLLSSKLESMPSEKNVLYNFLPEKPEEEKIFDNVNFLASGSGLAIYKIVITPPKGEAVANSSGEPSTVSDLKSLKTEAKISGGYEKIKEFLANMEKMDRYNSLSSLTIETSYSEDAESPNFSALLSSVTADFSVMKKTALSSNSINDPIFTKNQLDTEIISRIKEQKKVSEFRLNIDKKGKENPFSF